MNALEEMLFSFLCQKYVQRADTRQTKMGLQYTEAETHDLAKEICNFIAETPYHILLQVKER
jgi:hypothetical protein